MNQDADQIVGRFRPALLDHPHHVSAVGGEGVHGDLDIRVRGGAAQRAQQIVGPFEEHLAFLGTHTEHVPDDRHRQRRGQVPDEVALATFADGVDQRSLT